VTGIGVVVQIVVFLVPVSVVPVISLSILVISPRTDSDFAQTITLLLSLNISGTTKTRGIDLPYHNGLSAKHRRPRYVGLHCRTLGRQKATKSGTVRVFSF
jgi:hypothetical protein